MKRLALLLFLLVTGQTVFSQNINDALRLGVPGLGSSARALGMGNAFIGLSDDNGASFFNPAGFGLMRKMEFSGGLDYSNFKNSTTLLGSSTTNSSSATRLSDLSFAFPFPTMRGSLVFGLAYHTNKDFNAAQKFDAINNGSSFINFLTDRNSNITYNLRLSYPSIGNDAQDTTILGRGLNQSGKL